MRQTKDSNVPDRAIPGQLPKDRNRGEADCGSWFMSCTSPNRVSWWNVGYRCIAEIRRARLPTVGLSVGLPEYGGLVSKRYSVEDVTFWPIHEAVVSAEHARR